MHLGCAIESRGKPPYGRCGGARRACAVRPCDRPGATHRDEQSPCVCVPHSPAQAVGVQLVRRAAAGAGCERGGGGRAAQAAVSAAAHRRVRDRRAEGGGERHALEPDARRGARTLAPRCEKHTRGPGWVGGWERRGGGGHRCENSTAQQGTTIQRWGGCCIPSGRHSATIVKANRWSCARSQGSVSAAQIRHEASANAASGPKAVRMRRRARIVQVLPTLLEGLRTNIPLWRASGGKDLSNPNLTRTTIRAA